MLFTSSGTFYSKVQFKTEEEVEKVVAVMNRETKNKITELCIAEIGKQKEFSKLLESDLKIQQIHVHGFVQKILEKDPIVSLPIDYSPSDLEEWASMQKVEVQIQHIEKYMNGKGEVLYDFPDLELTQENESLKTIMGKLTGIFQISRWNRMFPKFTTSSPSVAKSKMLLMPIKLTWMNCDKSSKRLGIEGRGLV